MKMEPFNGPRIRLRGNRVELREEMDGSWGIWIDGVRQGYVDPRDYGGDIREALRHMEYAIGMPDETAMKPHGTRPWQRR